MKFWYLFLLSSIVLPLTLLSSAPIQTDYAIFLFDNGDKNMIASMLNYARKEDASTLDRLDFRIVFMGASVDAMSQAPFCYYPDRLIHYKQLGIDETVDHTWKRDGRLCEASIDKLSQTLHVRKKVWIGVSCVVFEQILRYYQSLPSVAVTALRDNPSPDGDTDYFAIAAQVQQAAKCVAVPSRAAAEKLTPQQEVVIIGHAPIEEWCDEAKSLDKDTIVKRLGLNPLLPIVVYTGSYGDYYENCFKLFLDLIPDEPIQVLIVPHPRYKGVIERKYCADRQDSVARIKIVGEFETDPLSHAKTVEALCIADAVFTADATSTVVFQANALNKKVCYVNPVTSKVCEALCEKITTSERFLNVVETIQSSEEDAFELLGMPRNGAKLLWQEFVR